MKITKTEIVNMIMIEKIINILNGETAFYKEMITNVKCVEKVKMKLS